MPTYDYRCKGCGDELEMFQSITAKPKRKCPACGEMKLERLIGTGAAVLFKGSGFYQTDYRSESYKKAADADKPSDAKPSKDSKPDRPAASAKSEGSKPAAKDGPKKPSPAKK